MKTITSAFLVAFLSLSAASFVGAAVSDDDDNPRPKSLKERMKALEEAKKKSEESPRSAAKSQPTSKIRQCTKDFEDNAEEEVPAFIMRYCQFDRKRKETHKAILKDAWLFEYSSNDQKLEKAEEISDRMRKRHAAIIRKHAGAPRREQCEAIVEHLRDSGANTQRRKANMEKADQKKDELIAEFSEKAKKGQLSEEKIAYLLMEGVIYNEDSGKLTKTKDKLIEVKNGFVPNPVNPDAMEAFTMFVHRCRGASASKIYESVGTNKDAK